jgi:hypothetical protein
MGVMSIFRGNLPMNGSYASRYFIYSHLIVAITFTFLLLKLNERKYQIHTAVVSVIFLFIIYSYNFYEGEAGFNDFYSLMKNSEFNYPDSPRAKQITNESCRLKIYCIEEAKADTKW